MLFIFKLVLCAKKESGTSELLLATIQLTGDLIAILVCRTFLNTHFLCELHIHKWQILKFIFKFALGSQRSTYQLGKQKRTNASAL